MIKSTNILRQKWLVALCLVCITHISLGSFTGTTDESTKNKYSLKNFNKNFYKKASPYSIRAGFEYKGVQIVSQQTTPAGVSFNSVIRFEKGNTIYIYPYRHTVIVSKFKTPTPTSYINY